MRDRLNRLRRVAAVGAVLAGALGTGTGGTAVADQQAAVVVPCPQGFVCLSENPNGAGRMYRLAQGTAAHLGSVLVAEATNNTSIDYCVIGTFSYLLRPGETQTQDSFVRSVMPRPTSGTCPV
ncbi:MULTISPECIES: peptidase inhibitor family I36 protein [unclassified Streptomyces]|uniref:peptidase inhibitor family I36 protein n=1 Tax=unclassified Streptomyces TaxID=2593676 RepID=UPI002E784E99|nr:MULTISPECIES: peptidase inhibitor family I36 protein [unclassified Streptomyces]MEE1758947.1 peptidase inhibitor family I36 protein [Streptomyces sp. SP18BB07]MEE1833868.1 peptidase inhibitor family I36 protein [Streptomyces sp. SP17KL33]